jgi:hypothetical protein
MFSIIADMTMKIVDLINQNEKLKKKTKKK